MVNFIHKKPTPTLIGVGANSPKRCGLSFYESGRVSRTQVLDLYACVSGTHLELLYATSIKINGTQVLLRVNGSINTQFVVDPNSVDIILHFYLMPTRWGSSIGYIVIISDIQGVPMC
jgi:hypothetical protein